MPDSYFPATKSTIMVVDDDPDLVTLIRAILEQKEFNVLCAYDGPQALAGLEKQKPDLILLDIMMPEMDGFEVLRRLKAAPETSSIPVILLSALNQLKDISTGYEMGADHYITKPFTIAHLMTVIDHLLSGDKRHSVECLYEGQYGNVQDKVAIHQKIILGDRQ
ncbi:MAG: response regulator [Syntrophobacteria bacterium]